VVSSRQCCVNPHHAQPIHHPNQTKPTTLPPSNHPTQPQPHPKATGEMHTALRGVPALVLSCDADVFTDPHLKDEFRRKVVAYVQFTKVGAVGMQLALLLVRLCVGRCLLCGQAYSRACAFTTRSLSPHKPNPNPNRHPTRPTASARPPPTPQTGPCPPRAQGPPATQITSHSCSQPPPSTPPSCRSLTAHWWRPPAAAVAGLAAAGSSRGKVGGWVGRPGGWRR